jgi:aspartate/methionine/tyrosine aminotransferase
MPESLFASLYRRLEQFEGRVIPFHIGDTHLAPPEAARLGNQRYPCDAAPELYRYAPPPGGTEFVDAILAKVIERNHMRHATALNIQITGGATHALSCAVQSIMSPGDTILVLSPFWPLIRGISIANGLHAVEVPFSHVLLRNPESDIEQLIESYVDSRSAAIYMCTPNNPDGKVYTEAELESIARVARRHNLWVISDEVYENFVFDGRTHHSIANVEGMAERTITVFSFSKSYGLAGLRVGYLVGPAEAVVAVRKMCNHTIYSIPRALQQCALGALTHGDEFIAAARDKYTRARDLAFEKVIAPCARPQGSTYLFLDLSKYCRRGEDSCLGVLERLAEAGLLLAPGGGFGHLYARWARLCYTTVDMPELEEGIERLNSVLGELAQR